MNRGIKNDHILTFMNPSCDHQPEKKSLSQCAFPSLWEGDLGWSQPPENNSSCSFKVLCKETVFEKHESFPATCTKIWEHSMDKSKILRAWQQCTCLQKFRGFAPIWLRTELEMLNPSSNVLLILGYKEWCFLGVKSVSR